MNGPWTTFNGNKLKIESKKGRLAWKRSRKMTPKWGLYKFILGLRESRW